MKPNAPKEKLESLAEPVPSQKKDMRLIIALVIAFAVAGVIALIA